MKPGGEVELPAELIASEVQLQEARTNLLGVFARATTALPELLAMRQCPPVPDGSVECSAPAEPARPPKILVPVSRFNATLIAMLLVKLKVVSSISARTIARWLKADKIKPWRFRSWITPKDLPTFLARACPVLDLYERIQSRQLAPDEVTFSIDEKTSIQAREHATYKPTGGGEPAHLEHTYKRRGAVHLIAALDVVTGLVTGGVFANKRFAEFSTFLHDLITGAIAQGAQKIHLILDNGSTHRPKYLATWIAEKFPDAAIEVHWLPVRSSWLNQVEIFFGILQRHALTPNDFPNTNATTKRILDFIDFRNEDPKPIKWTYTSEKLRAKHANRETISHGEAPAPIGPIRRAA